MGLAEIVTDLSPIRILPGEPDAEPGIAWA